MEKNITLVLLLIFLTGCSVKSEGVFLGSYEHKFNSINAKNCEYSRCPEQVVMVGSLSAYREFTSDTSKLYSAYEKAAKKFVNERPISLTKEQFDSSFSGWTMLQVFQIPLVASGYVSMLIPIELPVEVEYASVAEAFLVQGTGDLVLARSNEDGLFYLDRLLCERKHGFDDYTKCKRRYRRGWYDAKTGEELNAKALKKKNGRKINLDTYELVRE